MPNTSGLVNRRNVIATSDATVVSRLKQAGAIPLGVTNCSELCMWYESSNRVYGRTNNPYDLQRIVGGSSGEPRHLGTVLHERQVKIQQGKSSKSLHTAINVSLGSCRAYRPLSWALLLTIGRSSYFASFGRFIWHCFSLLCCSSTGKSLWPTFPSCPPAITKAKVPPTPLGF